MSTVSNSVNSVNSVNSFNSVNSVNSVNSYSAVLPPSPMVFLFKWNDNLYGLVQDVCQKIKDVY